MRQPLSMIGISSTVTPTMTQRSKRSTGRDLGDDRLGRLRGGMVVHRHRPARARQVERDGAADAPSGPGDQGGARIVVGMRRFCCGGHARQSA